MGAWRINLLLKIFNLCVYTLNAHVRHAPGSEYENVQVSVNNRLHAEAVPALFG